MFGFLSQEITELYGDDKNGLLIIGYGLNGDPIVIDLKTKNIGYIFHDELWED